MSNIREFFYTHIIHPFLFTLISVIYLYQFVVTANLPLRDLLLLIPMVLLITLIFFCVMKCLIHDKIKAGILTSIILLPVLCYGSVVQKMVSFNQAKARYLIPVIILLWIPSILIVIKSKKTFKTANLFLNIVAIVAVAINTFITMTVVGHVKAVQAGLQAVTQNQDRLEVKAKAGAEPALPDIYYIITDAHTSSESLERFWGYNASFFITHLRDKGFYIAGKSHSNYRLTALSLAASFNIEYHPSWSSLSQLSMEILTFQMKKVIKNSKTVKFLTSNGYDIINLSFFDLGENEAFYPSMVYCLDIKSVMSAFFERTMIFPIYRHLAGLPSGRDIGRNNLKIISSLMDLPKKPHNKPIFVFAHLMMPHEPYVFDADGNLADWGSRGIYDDKQKYLQYLIYTDKVLMKLVDNILSYSQTPPIIILQGDHGSRLLNGEEGKLEDYTILNTYYLPNGGEKILYDSIAPVNTFRVIFNFYFGADLNLIEHQPDFQHVIRHRISFSY